MSDAYLNLRERGAVADFLQTYAPFAEPKAQAEAERLAAAYQSGEEKSSARLAEAARTLGKAVWPARYALGRYVEAEGAKEEWRRVSAAVRPSTGHLLEAVREASGDKTLDEVLKTADAERAFRDEDERIEIAAVRAEVRLSLWKEHKDALKVHLKDGQERVKAYVDRLSTLREMGGSMPEPFQGEIFSKLERFEDRVFFAGELIPLELLDDEIRYYRDQGAILPEDEPTLGT